MSPQNKAKARKRKQTTQQRFPFFRKLHLAKVKQGLQQVQESMPKELFQAVLATASTEGKGLLKTFIKEDVKDFTKQYTFGSAKAQTFKPRNFFSFKNFSNFNHTIKDPLVAFWNQIKTDLSQKEGSEKATYLIKVATLFASAALSLHASLQITKLVSLKFKKKSHIPWAPSLALVLLSKLLSRLLSEACLQLSPESDDYKVAQFLIANLEILSFGGSLGGLSRPEFLDIEPTDDSLKLIRQLIYSMFDLQEPQPTTLSPILLTPSKSTV